MLMDSVTPLDATNHHAQVREHVAGSEHCLKRLEGVRHACRPAFHSIQIGSGRSFVPLPSVSECLQLGSCKRTILLPKENVIRSVRIKRWVQIHQVNRLIVDLLAQYVEIVAMVQLVLPAGGGGHRNMGLRAARISFQQS